MADLGKSYVGIAPDGSGFAEKASAQITAALKSVDTNVPVTVDQRALARSLTAASAQFSAALKARNIPVNANTTAALTKLAGLSTATTALQAKLGSLRASVDDTAAEAKIAALQVRANTLAKALAGAGPDTDLSRYDAQLLKIAADSDRVTDSTTRVNIVSGNWFSTLVRIGGTAVPLFGGAIGAMVPALENADSGILKLANHLVNTTSGWHLMTEAVVETLAIWGPATIAAVTFGAAAAPAVETVVKQLQNMNTVSQATGQQFQSLARSGESVTAAVKPSVLEAFGIGLNALKTSSGTLAPQLATLGSAFDQLAAKLANAFSSKAGGTFFAGASDDLLKLIDSFTALGSIAGSVLKSVPGYAEVLLQFGDDALHGAAGLTAMLQPALQLGLALHGAVLYGGLAGTAVAFGFSKIASGAASGALGVATAAEKILGSENKISAGALAVGGALEDIGGGPVLLGIGLVTGAIAALVVYLKASQTAATSFGATIQKTLANTAVTSLPQALAASLAEANAKAAASQAAYTQAVNQTTEANKNLAAAGRGGEAQLLNNDAALQKVAATNAVYSGTQAQLSQQSKNLNLNLAAIAATTGTSIPQALALANGAQVSSNQLLAQGGANWAVISTMVAGYIAQLKVMTPGVGQLNQALNVLNVTQSTQVTDAQKLGQAYTQFIGIVTGGDSAFVSFEQGLSGVNAKLTGTSTAALAARGAFDQEVQGATTLYGNLQTMATVSGNTASAQSELAKAGKDLVAQLLPMAAGSQTATAEVGALSALVGGPATTSFKALQQWVGSTKGAEADLDSQQAKLTQSSANLTQAAKDLASAMQNQVTAGEAAAIAKATNLTGIQGQLATAVENANGKFTTAAANLAGQYYQALIKAGGTTDQAKGQVDAFLAKMGETPQTIAAVNAALASLNTKPPIGSLQALLNEMALIPRNITTTITVQQSNAIAQGFAGVVRTGMESGGIVHAARGYMVRGGGPSGKDSQLIMAAPGELVIPAAHAPKFAAMARKASIPGFAGGGMPEPAFGVLAGQPYSFASNGPDYVPPASVAGGNPGLPPMNSGQGAQLIELLTTIAKQNQQMPYSLGNALNTANAAGVRRGFFATGG